MLFLFSAFPKRRTGPRAGFAISVSVLRFLQYIGSHSPVKWTKNPRCPKTGQRGVFYIKFRQRRAGCTKTGRSPGRCPKFGQTGRFAQSGRHRAAAGAPCSPFCRAAGDERTAVQSSGKRTSRAALSPRRHRAAEPGVLRLPLHAAADDLFVDAVEQREQAVKLLQRILRHAVAHPIERHAKQLHRQKAVQKLPVVRPHGAFV